jgi:hypothetical protein
MKKRTKKKRMSQLTKIQKKLKKARDRFKHLGAMRNAETEIIKLYKREHALLHPKRP